MFVYELRGCGFESVAIVYQFTLLTAKIAFLVLGGGQTDDTNDSFGKQRREVVCNGR